MAVLKPIRLSGKYLGTKKVKRRCVINGKKFIFEINTVSYEKLKYGWVIRIYNTMYKVVDVTSLDAIIFPLRNILKENLSSFKEEQKYLKHQILTRISLSSEVLIYGIHRYKKK